MKVLVACEFSGVVRDAFIERGHDAVSCDILPTERPGPHLMGNVLQFIELGWDLMIAHPPCTYLCNSGVRWLHTDRRRWKKMRRAAQFFRTLLEAPIPMVAVENPIMHGYGTALVGRTHSQIIQPWQHGHAEQKATCLWLRGLPQLIPSKVARAHHEREQAVFHMGPSDTRWLERSRTYEGIAAAMAVQWGGDHHQNWLWKWW